MKQLAIVGAALLGVACGGKQGGAIGGRGGRAPHGPVLVFVPIGSDMVFEGDCYDPSETNCEALRKQAMDGTRRVSAGAILLRITGPVSDECEASGATDVVGVERVAGPEGAPPAVLGYPADVPLAIEDYGTRIDVDQASPPPPTVTDELRNALVRAAAADLSDGDEPGAVTPGEIMVEQVVSTDVDGDGKPDTLVTANIPRGEEEGPGYVWSALVVLPGGDAAKARSAWKSDLEHLTIDASFDLEGDGARELVYSAEYYEGGGRGVASIVNGKLEFAGQWGCGA